MLVEKEGAIKSKRVPMALIGLALLLCGAIGFAVTGRHLISVEPPASDRQAPDPQRVDARLAPKAFMPTPDQQSSGQFDQSRSVIAGGGGESSLANLKVEGTIGQSSAGTTMTGGQFAQVGGFWQTESVTAPTPTPTPGSTPTPIPTPTSTPTPTPTPNPNVVQFSSSNYGVTEGCTMLTVTINRLGDTSAPATVDYATSDAIASERRDYITALGSLRFAGGETSKNVTLLINDDSYLEGAETFSLVLSNPSGATLGAPAITTVTINDNPTEPATNVIDDPATFVGQHYHDFLNRQADGAGLDFWTTEVASCSNAQCLENKRINVSAAFFLSIEFQQTGCLIEHLYKSAYGDGTGTSTIGGAHQVSVPIVRLNEFIGDLQRIGQGVVVLQSGWEQSVETNKQAFALEFVQRTRFANTYPTSMTPAQFVDTLNQHAGGVLSANERATAIGLFGGASDTTSVPARAQVLRQIAEDSDLSDAERNRAFVLMQYFEYLRRNPDDAQDSDYSGYDFWLSKLNQFNGNFIDAEMVKAFINSAEYRQRFGP